MILRPRGPPPRLFGLGPRALVEVTATDTHAAEAPVAGRPARAASAAGASARPTVAGLAGAVRRAAQPAARDGRDPEPHGRIDHLLPDLPAELVPTYSQLIEADVPEVLARRLVRHVAEGLEPDQFDHPESIRAALCEAVEQCIPVAPPIRRSSDPPGRGPGGADGRRQDDDRRQARGQLQAGPGVRVGLVTVDTYRIAAVEQLRTYAEIIDLPLAVVNDPAEMARALDELGAVDLVLHRHRRPQPARRGEDPRAGRVPAPGRPGRDPPGPRAPSPASGASGPAVERFATVQVDRLILTKLDEADSLGGVLGRARPVQPPGELPHDRARPSPTTSSPPTGCGWRG